MTQHIDDEDVVERGPSTDAAAVAVAADVEMRARAVSCVPRAAPVVSTCASAAACALSSDWSRCDSGRSFTPSSEFDVVLALDVADLRGGVEAED